MPGYIVDRRLSGKNKSIPSRNRLLERVKARVKSQVKNMISNGSIGRIFEDTKRITIPVGDVTEPYPTYSEECGVTDLIVTGNTKYRVGDLISRRQSGGSGAGNGNGTGPGEDSEDEFAFTLTRDEFLKYFFEDLELPNLVDKEIQVVEEYRSRKAGYSASGNPSNMSLLRTMSTSIGRRVALEASLKKRIAELEAELETDGLTDERIEQINLKLVDLRKRSKQIPFVDEIDLRYRTVIHEPVPNTQAVMFCMLDASGSMTSWHKNISKRFFMMLYLFLHKQYERIELVFVRYTHQAAEVDENDFFYSRETGGTIASTGLEKIKQIIADRYDRRRYNIYVAHASDGDQWESDTAQFDKILREDILPVIQHYFYIEVTQQSDDNDLMRQMKAVESQKLKLARVTSETEIFNVFREIFKPQ